MIDFSGIWTPRVGQERETPFGAGIRRAMGQAFPLAADDALPERMKAAIQALADLEPVIPADQLLGSAR